MLITAIIKLKKGYNNKLCNSQLNSYNNSNKLIKFRNRKSI